MTPFMSVDHQMACNGMSSIFSQNFILQMQNPHEDDDDERHHRHHHQQLHQPTQPIRGKRSMSFSGVNDEMNDVGGGAGGVDDDLSDDCSLAGEKKRRLNVEQVRTLEKNFELGNKLEPERKMQLARALGLQPRQIAIWFQNRRARWKTKQLEKDYDVLRRQFEALKCENEALQTRNKKLQDEIAVLKGRENTPEPINLNKETEGSSSSEANPPRPPPPPETEAAAPIHIGLNHHHHYHEDCPAFFAAAAGPPMRPVAMSMTQLLQSASRNHVGGELVSPKMEPPGSAAAEENFCTMFCAMDDPQQPFWAWPDHPSFH